MLRIQRGLPKIALETFELHSQLSRSNLMILPPIPRLHSQFQHPIDHGHISMLEKQFPNFALFTTLLGRVRLSQSVGCKTTTILHFWRFVANPTHCLSCGQSCLGVGLFTTLAFIPTLNGAPLERGTSRRSVKGLDLSKIFAILYFQLGCVPATLLSIDIKVTLENGL
jgi:hypothetical protein